jgi:hypothetical protein
VCPGVWRGVMSSGGSSSKMGWVGSTATSSSRRRSRSRCHAAEQLLGCPRVHSPRWRACPCAYLAPSPRLARPGTCLTPSPRRACLARALALAPSRPRHASRARACASRPRCAARASRALHQAGARCRCRGTRGDASIPRRAGRCCDCCGRVDRSGRLATSLVS